MLDSILSTIKEQASSELKEKAGVNESQIPQIFDVVGNVAKDKIGAQLSAGNIGALMNLFSDKENNAEANQIQSAMQSGIIEQLSVKLGFDSGKAGQIANLIIPYIMNFITKKNNETPDTDTSVLTDLLGKSGLADKAKGMLGGLFK